MAVKSDFFPQEDSWPRASGESMLMKALLVGAVFILQSIFFGYVALRRLVAPDEGFYLLAARLVTEGYSPYIDFFYPQMPYLPYIYGLWNLAFGNDWAYSRLLSALFTSSSGALLFYICLRKAGFIAGFVSVVLFCSSNFVFPWYVTSQTYAASVFFLLCAYTSFMISLSHATGRPGFRGALILSGVFLGVASGVRLFFAGLIPVFLLHILFSSQSLREKIKNSGWILLGVILSLVPAFLLALLDREAFYFSNLGYHLIRSDGSFEEGLPAKFRMVKVLFGFIEARQFAGFSIAILLYLSLFHALNRLLMRKLPDLAFSLALSLFVINFLPTPSYHQYFSTLVPFLIICSLLFLSFLAGIMGRLKAPGAILFLLLAAFPIWQHIRHFPTDFHNFTISGQGVTGIGASRPARFWNIETISKVSKAINRYSEKGDIAVSIWPGYLFEAEASIMPGLENHFGRRVAGSLTSDERKRYRLVTDDEVAKSIRDRQPEIVLISVRRAEAFLLNAVAEAGYVSVETVGGVEIYRRP